MAADEIRTISPSTGEVIFEGQGATLPQIKDVVQRSTAAFETFKSIPLAQRMEIVRKALEIVQRRKVQLAEELTEQMGRPIAYSVKEIETMQKRADYLLASAEKSLEDIPGTAEEGFKRFVRKEARGPTLVVFAWNFPWLIVVGALVPALLAGNSVILKPSPQTPIVGERLVEIFSQAGLPDDVLQCVQIGNLDTLQAMVRMPEIKVVTFTGSNEGGIALRRATADRIVPLTLELGGKDPAYVRYDCDIPYVTAQIVDGAIFNSGQSCCSIERVYVHDGVYDQFVEEAKKILTEYRLGDPFDRQTHIGPVISRAAQVKIEEQIQDALQKGAIDATPQNATFQDYPKEGNYVAPRLLLNVTHEMRMMTEETFGPVIPIMRVSSDEEAIRLMNDSRYGLSASIWTKNVPKGESLIEKLDAGTVFVNRSDYPSPDLAWVGWKDSGLGCSLGPEAFSAFYRLKSFHVKEKQA